MNIDTDLIKTPLFIIKKLQRDSFRRHASILKARVLDIGCGIQPYRRYLKGVSYFGMDELYGVRPRLCGRAEYLPFRDSSLDSVICAEVLEHLERPQECISEIKRILKPGGAAYITVPQSWPLHYQPHDYWRFTKYGLTSILASNGLKVISVERIGGPATLIGQEIVDVVWTTLKRALSFIGPVWSERVSTAVSAPFALLVYLFGTIADGIDKRYALGWAAVVVK